MNDQAITAVCLPPSTAFLDAVDEAWSRGDAVLPLDPSAPVPATEAVCTRVRPSTYVDERGSHVRPGGHAVPAGTALVVPTSGTTGLPKGVVLSHEALLASIGASLARLGCSDGERWLCCLPTHHVAGLQVLLRSRALGRPALVLDHFSVSGVAAALAESVDLAHVSLVPTQLSRLLDAGVDLSGLRTILLGGAAASPTLLARAADLGLRVVTSYGMTETSGGCVYDRVPLDGVDVRVDDDGRVLLRGPMLFDGYLGEPERTRQVFHDGWLRTADRGRIEDDGRLTVLGRADDVIVSGGENLPSERIGALLRAMDGVADAVVVGVDDPIWGQRAVAVVESGPGGLPTLDQVRTEVARTAPRAWAPRQLVVVERVPRTSLDKYDLPAARRLAAGAPPDGRRA